MTTTMINEKKMPRVITPLPDLISIPYLQLKVCDGKIYDFGCSTTELQETRQS